MEEQLVFYNMAFVTVEVVEHGLYIDEQLTTLLLLLLSGEITRI